MDQNPQNHPENIPHPSADFGSVPNSSEEFGTVRNDTEGFPTIPHISERNQNHTLTVREVARMFEAAGVARTERSIVNWCQPNRTGIARLDSYFDPNERRYYISPQSVEQAIAEEKAKATKNNETSEPIGSIPQNAETVRKTKQSGDDESRVNELERENLDLKITNRGKDFLIEQMQKERNVFFDQLLSANRKVGELGTKLLQIESPTPSKLEQ
jgi:hypothetical protein